MLLKLAWRNILRNKRRSFLTLAAIVFATFAALALRGIQQGTFALNIKTAVEIFSGYLQVQEKGYLDNPSLNSSFVLNNKIISGLENTKGIEAYSPRIYGGGLISYKDESRGINILGIEPSSEKNVTVFIKNLNHGKFFKSDSSNNIVLGEKLMNNLNAHIGDEVILLAQGYDGTLGNQKFRISGTVKLGVQEMESAIVFMGIKTAQALLAMGNRVNVVAIKADNIDRLNYLGRSLAQKIDDNNLSVLTWDKINPSMANMLQFSNVRGIIFSALLIVIVAFGILNTVLMSVTERFREFGVILAIGMPHKKLMYIIYMETFLLTMLGLAIGNFAGYALNTYFITHPIIFRGELQQLYSSYHFLPEAVSSVKISIFTNVSLSVLVISLLSCLYPAFKAYKLEPLKGIRYT